MKNWGTSGRCGTQDWKQQPLLSRNLNTMTGNPMFSGTSLDPTPLKRTRIQVDKAITLTRLA
eukprot:743691-Amphidinium_carterae.2